MPPRDGFDEVRVPGESRARYAEAYARDGIPLAPYLLEAVTKTARELGVATPW